MSENSGRNYHSVGAVLIYKFADQECSEGGARRGELLGNKWLGLLATQEKVGYTDNCRLKLHLPVGQAKAVQ